jgi:hypothetical protein
MTLYCTQESAVPKTTSINPMHFPTNQRQELVQEELVHVYSLVKAQESLKLTDRMHPNKITGQRRRRRQSLSYYRSPSSKTSGFLLLMMLSILGVVQALTDCQIMHDWLPAMFNGTGIACCEEIIPTSSCRYVHELSKCSITCVNDRITQMYVD